MLQWPVHTPKYTNWVPRWVPIWVPSNRVWGVRPPNLFSSPGLHTAVALLYLVFKSFLAKSDNSIQLIITVNSLTKIYKWSSQKQSRRSLSPCVPICCTMFGPNCDVSIFMTYTLREPPLKYRYSRLRRLSRTITLTLYIHSIFYTRVRSDVY